jgi:uncharacterized protein
MPTMRLQTPVDIEDFVWGCTFFGTGGGGNPEKGIAVLRQQLDAGRELRWVDCQELDDAEWIACPGGMGSTVPLPGGEELIRDMGLGERYHLNYLSPAVQGLARYTGKEISALIATELGGSNTPAVVATAAELGLQAVDGDYAGRAKPEVTQSTYSLAGKTIVPLCTVDPWGNTCFVDRVVVDGMAERIGKMLAVASFGAVGMAGRLIRAGELKQIAIKGTLTECLELGRSLRSALQDGRDPVPAVLTATAGWLLFKGKVTERRWKDQGGYFWGEHDLVGIDEFEGHTFRIWFKNENHLSWLDDQPHVTSPDILAIVDLDGYAPLVTPAIRDGHRLAVIGVQARAPFRTPAGLELMGPRHFGFDMDYVPVEELVRR